MRYPLDKYLKLTRLSHPQLADKLTEIRRLKGDNNKIYAKTLWNWSNERYSFRVVIECDDNNIDEITGAFKEIQIL